MSDAGKSPLAALKRPLPTIKTRGLNDRRLGSIQATGKSRDSDLNPSKEPLPANLPKAVVKPALSSLATTRFEPKASFEPFVLSPGPKPDLSEFDVSPGPSPTHRASLSQNPAKLPATQSKTPSMSRDLSPRVIMAAAERSRFVARGRRRPFPLKPQVLRNSRRKKGRSFCSGFSRHFGKRTRPLQKSILWWLHPKTG